MHHPTLPVRRTLIALALLPAFTPALAQTEASPSTTSARLDPVIVTASRSTTRLEDMPLHTSVITREDIARSPARTLDQLLRDVPGMNLSGAPFNATDPTGHQMRMRGVTNSKVLVLLDGVPIHDPFYSTIQWFKLALSSIERVEIIRGGNSSLWGNMAVAGVINIVSKTPQGNGGDGSVSVGSASTTTAALGKNLALGESLGLRIAADALKTDGYNTTPAEFLAQSPGRGASADEAGNLQLSAAYTPTKDLRAFVRLGVHRQDETIGGYTYGSNLQRSPDFAAGISQRLADRRQWQANLWAQKVHFDKQNGAGCYLQANGRTCNTTAPTDTVVQYFAQRDLNTYRESGASTLYSMRLGAHSLQFGADLRRLSGEDTAEVFNVPTGPSVDNATLNRTVYGQGAQRFAGLFAQLKVEPVQDVEVTASARFDTWRNTDGVSRLTKASTGTTLGGAVEDSSKNSFNPALALRWALADEWALRAAAYKSFRAPGLNNLYRSFSSATSITLANPTLKPETLTGGEIGADYRDATWSIGLTGFHMKIKDMIASYRVPNVAAAPQAVRDICGAAAFGSNGSNCPGNVNFNTNGQDGRSKGAELVVRVAATRDLDIDASYARTRSVFTRSTTGDPTGVQLGAVPLEVGTVGLTLRPAEGWTLYGQARCTGSMDLDIGGTLHQSGFTVLNVGAQWRATRGVELFAGVVNLFNTVYADNATTSAASKTLGQPRSSTLGARFEF